MILSGRSRTIRKQSAGDPFDHRYTKGIAGVAQLVER